MTELAADYVIVGAGLTGITMARLLADAGREVLVVERRAHVGGNVHDQRHTSGLLIHTYGPHYFRTSAPAIWAYVNRFAAFYPFEAVIKSEVDGAYENWPVAASYIQRTVGAGWAPEFAGRPANFEEASLAMMPRLVYEKFVKGYTEKQWGTPARSLSARLAARFEVHADDEPRLKRHKYQGLPTEGYAVFMERMAAGIPLTLGFDYLERRDEVRPRRALVFTGAIDEFFGCDLGRLKYRGQHRQHRYLPDTDLVLPCAQVNNPDPANGAHIRTLEWKHLLPPAERASVRGTVLTTETPLTATAADQFEYPFPDAANAALYQRYRRRVSALDRVVICGRLGEYRYYDMDQAIGRAMHLARRLLRSEAPRLAGPRALGARAVADPSAAQGDP